MKQVALAVSLLLLVGCVTPPAIEPVPPQEYRITAPTAVVWQAVADVYADLGIPIDNMDRESGFIRGGPLPIYSQFADEPVTTYLDCGREGGGEVAQNKYIELRMTTLVREREGGAIVRTQLQAHSMDRVEPCVSRGKLEQRIAQALIERVR